MGVWTWIHHLLSPHPSVGTVILIHGWRQSPFIAVYSNTPRPLVVHKEALLLLSAEIHLLSSSSGWVCRCTNDLARLVMEVLEGWNAQNRAGNVHVSTDFPCCQFVPAWCRNFTVNLSYSWCGPCAPAVIVPSLWTARPPLCLPVASALWLDGSVHQWFFFFPRRKLVWAYNWWTVCSTLFYWGAKVHFLMLENTIFFSLSFFYLNWVLT